MASSTEYNMLFKLSAQLSQEFGTTFSSAKKSLNDTQKEIQALNKQQADISAYQKQQQAVDSTSRKLADLKKEYENIQREIQNTEGFSSSLENKLIEKKAAIDKASASLAQQTEKLDQMGEALRDAGVDTSNLGGESEKLKSQIDDLADEQARLAEEAENAGEKGKSAFSMVGDALIAAGIAKGLKEIYEFTIACADGSAKYADNILTMSAQYNIAAKDLQAYYYASELVDVSVETMTSSITKNTKSMYNAADGSKQYVEAYEKLGISVTDANGNIRDGMEVYWEVIDALGAMENETERDGIAMTLLGRSAMQLNTLIEAGSGVMGEYAEEAQKAGYILSDDVLAVCGKLDDAEQIQKNNLIGLKNTLGAQFAPELTAIKELENGVLEGLTKFTAEHPVIVKSIIAITAELGIALALYKGIPAAIAAVNTVKTISNALKAKSAVLTAKETAATVTQTVATKAETTAQVGLNAAMSANPIGLVIGAVAALTVGIIALVDVMKNEEGESKQLTAVSREQYDSLQALQSEYDAVCSTYGETSYEAQSLQWQIEELNEEYERSKQTIAEYNEAVEAANQRYDDAMKRHKDTVAEVERESSSISALVNKLSELTSQTSVTASEKQEILAIIKALNKEIPGLTLNYDEFNGSMDKTIEMVKSLAEAEITQRKYNEYQEELIKLMNTKSDASDELIRRQETETASANKLAEAQRELAEAEDYANRRWVGATPNGPEATQRHNYVVKYKNALAAAEKEHEKAVKDVIETQNDIKENQEKIDEQAQKLANLVYVEPASQEEAIEGAEKLSTALSAIRQGYLDVEKAASYYGITASLLQTTKDEAEANKVAFEEAIKAVEDGYYSAKEAAEIYGTTVEKIEGYRQIQDTITALDELVTKYSETYEAAEKSINGQYELWDTAAIVIATDIGSINTALETQLSYWSDYNTDLANLLARTDDVDGLAEVIASFADGSEDSVNAIAGMAAASDEDLKSMVSNWREVQTQQEKAAKSIAEIASGYSEELESMLDDVSVSVNALNLDHEATVAAKATVNAYAQAIRDGTWDAVKAAEDMAYLVANALSKIPEPTASLLNQNSAWSSYEDAAAAGYSNIRTQSEFARGNNSDKQKYGTYDAYLAAMQEKYMGNASGGSGGAGGAKASKNFTAYSAYASGTDSALPGFALVGEEGPELVSFRGGEQVYTADQTKALLADYKAGFDSLHAYASGTGEDVQIVMLIPLVESLIEVLRGQDVEKPQSALQRDGGQNVYITVSPSFTVESGNDNLEERLRSFSDIVTENVMNALDEAGIDAKRGAYV